MRYISLGFFCSIAGDLEKLGLRSESSPFDWVICDFEGVIKAIEEQFSDLFEYKYLYQSKDNPSFYKNIKYNIQFFHDFDGYLSLARQLPKVKEKYSRRIRRFYTSITEPTLFIRYISDVQKTNGKSNELIWIENNFDRILDVIQTFNKENDILFIANEGVSSEKIVIYHVQKDENDIVARNPLYKNPVLFDKFSNIEVSNKQANINRYINKQKQSIYRRLMKKIELTVKHRFLKKYAHEHQY